MAVSESGFGRGRAHRRLTEATGDLSGGRKPGRSHSRPGCGRHSGGCRRRDRHHRWRSNTDPIPSPQSRSRAPVVHPVRRHCPARVNRRSAPTGQRDRKCSRAADANSHLSLIRNCAPSSTWSHYRSAHRPNRFTVVGIFGRLGHESKCVDPHSPLRPRDHNALY